MPKCPLCQSNSIPFFKEEFFCCKKCKGIFRPKNKLPTQKEEETRYKKHKNNKNNIDYQKFVSPITNSILKNFTEKDNGVDFGSGKSSAITKILREKNYNIQEYDPFFHNKKELLTQKYNYIACCEVIEHFHKPLKEFKLLKKLLKKNGTLFCMTHLYNETIDFPSWYYQRDKTHVFIYQNETIEWIRKNLKFKEINIKNRLIEFTK